jgi:signal peptidase
VKIRRLTDTGEWTTRRYLSLLGNILIWAIVAIDGFYLWPTGLHGSTSMVIVSGHSMEPTYFTGDLVIARKMDPSVGDVIVYAPASLGGSQIVHRIIGGNATDGWKMQGDNNNFVDPFTPKGSEVKGVVLVHYANFGRVTVLLLNPIVWALVLLAAVVLLLWWSGDSCEDDPDDKDKDNDKRDEGGDPASEAEEEPDLIDRVVEGTEAAIARMITSGADAGAAALAMLTRPSPAPRHAASSPRHAASSPRRTAPGLLRGAAVLAVLGLLAIYDAPTASASQLSITPTVEKHAMVLAKCASQTLGAATSGSASAGSYTAISLSGIATQCRGIATTVRLYSSSGALLATGTATPAAATATFTTGSYSAAAVTTVVVTVAGWMFVASWTPPGPFVCEELTAWPGNPWQAPATYGVPTGRACIVSGLTFDAWGGGPSTPPTNFNLYFTVSGTTTGNWRVTVNFNDPYFQGLHPTSLSSNGNPQRSPGYACSQLPTFVGQTNLLWGASTWPNGYLSGNSTGGGGNLCP